MREQVLSLSKLTSPPQIAPADDVVSEGNLKAVYFDALPYEGKATKVFAWLGVPENRVEKLPGVVLVHGGGGTAFKDWVRLWTDRGFAAISIAVEGQTDQRDKRAASGTIPTGWKQHPWSGPWRSGIYGDSDKPLADQWMYHAVADTILANSLLRSLPQVDADKVGLMGISWGGIITSTVIGIDHRFAFAIPTYGCGHLADVPNQYGRSLGNNSIYREIWDPMLRIERAKMPVLWYSWPGDQHFPLDCQSTCYRNAGSKPMISLVPGMGHGHGAAWRRPESYAFAESVVRSGRPWCVQGASITQGNSLRVTFTSDKALKTARLVSTVDSGLTGQLSLCMAQDVA